jgi:uncharacterized protein YkwD
MHVIPFATLWYGLLMAAALCGLPMLLLWLAYVVSERLTTIEQQRRFEAARDLDSGEAKTREEFFRATNVARRRAGRSELQRDRALDRAAQAHAWNMAAKQFFAHTDRDGREPLDRLFQQTNPLETWDWNWGPWGWVAENIAGSRTPAAAVEALLRSPGHRRNMLHEGHTRVGVGWAVGLDGRTKAVQEFGTRLGD